MPRVSPPQQVSSTPAHYFERSKIFFLTVYYDCESGVGSGAEGASITSNRGLPTGDPIGEPDLIGESKGQDKLPLMDP